MALFMENYRKQQENAQLVTTSIADTVDILFREAVQESGYDVLGLLFISEAAIQLQDIFYSEADEGEAEVKEAKKEEEKNSKEESKEEKTTDKKDSMGTKIKNVLKRIGKMIVDAFEFIKKHIIDIYNKIAKKLRKKKITSDVKVGDKKVDAKEAQAVVDEVAAKESSVKEEEITVINKNMNEIIKAVNDYFKSITDSSAEFNKDAKDNSSKNIQKVKDANFDDVTKLKSILNALHFSIFLITIESKDATAVADFIVDNASKPYMIEVLSGKKKADDSSDLKSAFSTSLVRNGIAKYIAVFGDDKKSVSPIDNMISRNNDICSAVDKIKDNKEDALMSIYNTLYNSFKGGDIATKITDILKSPNKASNEAIAEFKKVAMPTKDSIMKSEYYSRKFQALKDGISGIQSKLK